MRGWSSFDNAAAAAAAVTSVRRTAIRERDISTVSECVVLHVGH